MSRERIAHARTLVVKVGSSLLASVKSGGGINTAFVASLVAQMAALRGEGRRLVFVTSGAVAAGMIELGLTARPKELPQIQAAAAVGQGALMELYRHVFGLYGLRVAQLLLTRDGLHDRRRFLHSRNTLMALLEQGVLPIINENDPVAVEELRLKMGDNDALAVSVAQLVDADALVILSDVPGLYDRPPSEDGANLIPEVALLTPELFGVAGGSTSGVGTGGMSSKLNAARAAQLAAIPLVVAQGERPNVLADVAAGHPVGTIFLPKTKRESSYRQWVAFGRGPDGMILVDDGARAAVEGKNRSLLPIGAKEIRGTFKEGDTVSLAGLDGVEFARGLSNFNSDEARRILGKRTNELAETLGHDCDDTLVHRDNLIVFNGH